MSEARSFDFQKHALGGALFLALIMGGGTRTGLWSDAVVQTALLLASAFSLTRRVEQSAILPGIRALCVVAALVGLVQLLPLPGDLVAATWPAPVAVINEMAGSTGGIRFLTFDLGNTIAALLYAFTVGFYSIAVMRLRSAQAVGLLPYFLAGVAFNALAAMVQYSISANIKIEGILPYIIRVGIFANENHFSTLICSAIPFVVFLAVYRDRRLFGLLAIAALLIVLFAAGSRAGVGIGVSITLLSVLVFGMRSSKGGLVALAAVVLAIPLSILAWNRLDTSELDPEFGRMEIARTTIAGIVDTFPVGVGYGNFPSAYEMYERAEMIFASYVNHAHNDYLEIAFEGGLLGIAALVLFLALFFARIFFVLGEPVQKAAFLALSLILIHSLVDYPLRTLAIATPFALFAGIYFSSDFRLRQPRRAAVRGEVQAPASRGRKSGVTAPGAMPEPRADARDATLVPPA